jgi:lysozyme
MNISDQGLELIKSFEGCKLEAYQDVKGVWTIGIGHTGSDVSDGVCITEDQAMDYLRQDVGWAEQVVNNLVTTALTQNQFDALVDFVYNAGSGNFKNSTLLRLVNAGDFDAAAQEFPKWDHAGGVVVEGLLRRREAERDLFLSA